MLTSRQTDLVPGPLRWAAYGALAVALAAVLTGCGLAWAGAGGGWLGVAIPLVALVLGACSPKSGGGHKSSGSSAASTLSIAAGESLDSAGILQFAVNRSGASGGAASVDYATSGGRNTLPGVNYTPVNGTLYFGAGETRKIVTVPLINDAAFELGKSITLNLSNPAGASLATASATSRILNAKPALDLSVAGALASPTTDGLKLSGLAAGDNTGASAAVGGDINGDGIPDLVIGAPSAYPGTGYQAGVVYVVFGQPGGFQSVPNLAALDGTNGFVVRGSTTYDHTGFSVASVGDVNGDGVDDILIGAIGSPGSAGMGIVIFGRPPGNPFPATLDVSNLGSAGLILLGVAAGDNTGRSVAAAGDFNGDGTADMIIGAPGAGGLYGAAYVVFGRAGGLPQTIDLGTLGAYGYGITIQGSTYGDQLGSSVTGGRDMDGDGRPDLLIGASYASPGNVTYTGEAFVIWGPLPGAAYPPAVNLAALGTLGIELDGAYTYDKTGSAVSFGDLNGDGLADAIIGAPYAFAGGTPAGVIYVVFGKDGRNQFPATGALYALSGSAGAKIYGIGAYDYWGRSLAAVGDVNGDGIEDLVVGGYRASPPSGSEAGKAFVVFGHKAGVPFADPLELSTLFATQGFSIYGAAASDWLGDNVAGAGDLNGDGINDFIVSSPQASPGGNTNAGASYVIFGGW